jgi:manganese/iron transport system substrate-binding protein
MRVLCVLAPGQDPHLYEIKPSDSRMVAQADLCLENGWHLEGNDWMKNLAKDAGQSQYCRHSRVVCDVSLYR